MLRPGRFGVMLLAGCLAGLVYGGAEDAKKAVDEKELRKLLRQSIQGGDDAALRETLKKMAGLPGREAARAALDTARVLPGDDEKYYWFLIEGAAGFRAPLAYSEMGDFIVQYRAQPIARDVLHTLQKGTHKYLMRVVRRVLDKCPADLQLMAVDMAARLPYRRMVDLLLPIYEREQAAQGEKPASELKLRIVFALEALTRQRMGDSLVNWQGWWAVNRHKGLKVLREEAEHEDGRTGLIQPLDPVRQRQFINLETLAGKVLVIKGCTARNGFNTNYDHIEEVLERLGLRPDVWEKTRLEDKDCPPLERYAAVFINCTQINAFCQSPGHQGGADVGKRLRECLGPNPHDEFKGKMKDPALQKIKAYVEGGGHLFTEDWVLIEVHEMIFGEYIGSGVAQDDLVVDIRAARGATSHPLLRGVFVPPVRLEDYDFGDDLEEELEDEKYDPASEDDVDDGDATAGTTGIPTPDPSIPTPELEEVTVDQVAHRWKIDKESPSIRVRSKKVITLVSSEHLKNSCGDPAVAVTFQAGKGTVFHVLSHFGKQESSQDEATLENLLVNFLLEVHIRTHK